MEVKKAKQRSEDLVARLNDELKSYEYMARLWNEFEPGLITITDVKLKTVKIAGVPEGPGRLRVLRPGDALLRGGMGLQPSVPERGSGEKPDLQPLPGGPHVLSAGVQCGGFPRGRGSLVRRITASDEWREYR